MFGVLVVSFWLMATSSEVPSNEELDTPLQYGTLISPVYDGKAWREGDPFSKWELSGLREGDIIDPIFNPARNVIRDKKSNWPNNTVIYRLQPGLRPEELLALKQGMKIITNGTCIKFRPYKRRDKDYIYILYNMTGCASFVGRQGGAQVMTLERNNCFHYGLIAAHELLHAIGLKHMHENFDRDEYIYINYSNVDPEFYEQFDKVSEQDYTDYGIVYDYFSIMHYGKFAYSKYKTILPEFGPETYSILPYADVEIGQTRYVSESDYLKVNTKYKCPGYEHADSDEETDESDQSSSFLSSLFG